MPRHYQDEDLLSLLLQHSRIGQECPLNINVYDGQPRCLLALVYERAQSLGQHGRPNGRAKPTLITYLSWTWVLRGWLMAC